VAAWLVKRGIADEDGSQAIGWLMDAEIYKLFPNIYRVFIQDLQKCTLAKQPLSRSSSNGPRPNEHEAFLWLIDLWNNASRDKKQTLNLITMGIFEYSSQQSKDGLWTDYRDSDCGRSILTIQKGFGVKHTVGNENLYVEGGGCEKGSGRVE
jgi:hypothetical protein